MAWCPHPPLLLPRDRHRRGRANFRLCARPASRPFSGLADDRNRARDGRRGSGSRARAARLRSGSRQPAGRRSAAVAAVGDWLLDQAGVEATRCFVGVRPDGTPASAADQAVRDRSNTEATALLVMGDGTARRSLKGPRLPRPARRALRQRRRRRTAGPATWLRWPLLMTRWPPI